MDQAREQLGEPTQDPEEIRLDTADGAPSAGPDSGDTLTQRQRTVLVRMIRVAYPHDRFPDGPYERTAAAVTQAAAASPETLQTLTAGLDALDAQAGGDFTSLDEAAATTQLEAIDTEPFFRQVHGTVVVALYDDREVWDLLGYEGSSFEHGGYLHRGFDDLDWLPDPRITESDEPRVELVPGPASRARDTDGGDLR